MGAFKQRVTSDTYIYKIYKAALVRSGAAFFSQINDQKNQTALRHVTSFEILKSDMCMNKRSFPDGWPVGTPAKSKRNSSDLNPQTDTDITESEIIELAWCDETTFDSIQSQTGRSEQEVIKLMRSRLKPSSFKLWRKRVSGRPAKHAARSNQRLKKIS